MNNKESYYIYSRFTGCLEISRLKYMSYLETFSHINRHYYIIVCMDMFDHDNTCYYISDTCFEIDKTTISRIEKVGEKVISLYVF